MNISFLLSAAFLPLFSFILPKGRHFAITITTQLLVAFISIAGVFTAYSGVSLFDSHFGIGGDLSIVPDAISGFFILIINLVCLLTTAYSQGYLAPYFSTKGKT
jgi:formate hydrogenlyase subunit 3/multisubunit Na+/H+ antiporter MnhD subunit